jgi:hemolysin activation/secretion protein
VFDGARLRLAGEASRASPDLARAGAVDGFETTLDEGAAAAVVTVPFVRTRASSVFGRIGIDWRRSRNATLFAGDVARSTDELLVLEAGVSWDRADRTGGVTILDLAIRQGLDVGPVRIGTEGPGAPDAGFTRAGVRLARVQRLGDGGWSVFGEVIGQAASAVLPGAERFSLGGATIGRGFAPGNTSGDSGLAGRLELRRLVALPGEGAAELYGFGDYGETHNRSDASGLPARQTIGSVGFGARIDVAPWLTLTPEVVRQTSGRAVDTTSPGLETRFFIGAVARF